MGRESIIVNLENLTKEILDRAAAPYPARDSCHARAGESNGRIIKIWRFKIGRRSHGWICVRKHPQRRVGSRRIDVYRSVGAKIGGAIERHTHRIRPGRTKDVRFLQHEDLSEGNGSAQLIVEGQRCRERRGIPKVSKERVVFTGKSLVCAEGEEVLPRYLGTQKGSKANIWVTLTLERSRHRHAHTPYRATRRVRKKGQKRVDIGVGVHIYERTRGEVYNVAGANGVRDRDVSGDGKPRTLTHTLVGPEKEHFDFGDTVSAGGPELVLLQRVFRQAAGGGTEVCGIKLIVAQGF